MGSANRVSILLFLLLCVNLSFARKFFYERHAHHSVLHSRQGMSRSIGSEPDPDQPDEAAYHRQIRSEPDPDQPDEATYHQQIAMSRTIGSEPDPDQPDGHRFRGAHMWTSRQVIAEEPPKGGSDPQDFGSGVLIAEPYHPPQKGFFHSIGSEPDPDQPDRHRSRGQVIAEEPPKGGSDPHDFGSVVLGALPEPSPRGFFYPYGVGSVAYYQQMAGKEGHGFGHVLGEEPKPPKGMDS